MTSTFWAAPENHPGFSEVLFELLVGRCSGTSEIERNFNRNSNFIFLPVRTVHSREFVCFFCFVSCKTSQIVNISQLLTRSKFETTARMDAQL